MYQSTWNINLQQEANCCPLPLSMREETRHRLLLSSFFLVSGYFPFALFKPVFLAVYSSRTPRGHMPSAQDTVKGCSGAATQNNLLNKVCLGQSIHELHGKRRKASCCPCSAREYGLRSKKVSSGKDTLACGVFAWLKNRWQITFAEHHRVANGNRYEKICKRRVNDN